PVVVAGKNGHATLDPAQIASVLSFEPDGRGSLKAVYHNDTATALLAPPLAAGETQPKEATFALASGKPVVVSSVDGEKVDWAKTLELLPAALVKPHDRTVQAVYQPQYPKLTTEAAQKLGVVEPIAEFTTGGFTGASGVNIATVARKVNGAVVLPGQIFSLNGFTGPRGEAQGYVESVIIDHGRPSKAVGGGISQFATTLYNAAYFAGLQDEGHTEHSYYISRYPAAREATVFDGVIDLKFRNNTPNGLLIEATTTSSKVTVRLWGTKHVDVESVTGERTKPTEPKQITLPEGKDCITSNGAPGFTISDTRIIRDHGSGREIYRHTRNVKYDPVPNVTCKSEP
ncbi:MAG: vancomycin resistance protein, partial [Mycobacteriaceae bacterium]|nr:vancomycin resistance protein [Mycobacteriaceae bacterium]